MPVFKSKGDQQNYTLDYQHDKFVSRFKKIQNDIPTKKKKLENLKKELNNINNINKKNIEISDFLFKKTGITNEIKQIESDILNATDKTEEIEYFRDVHDILIDYYNDTTESIENNIFNQYFDDNKIIEEDNEIEEQEEIPNTVRECGGYMDYEYQNDKEEKKFNSIQDFVETQTKSDKADLLDKYMNIIDDSYISEKNYKINNTICLKCNIDRVLIQSEGIFVCPKCGLIEFIVVDSEKPNYKEPLQETSYFCYKRINHFNEWLSQFQAKESTEIPQFVYDKIIIEIKKSRITNLALLTPNKMREMLKKLKFNKYYEHVPHIINKLNGLPPPVMSREIEEKLRSMFREIQEPFMTVCPKDRKNFLSYSYVLHKMCELLGLDEFLSCFPLLKSREKLHNQDLMWKKITGILGWEFIQSI